MPSYKENGKWFCKFYYEDWNGQRKQKKKSGFRTKREADAWEREFLELHTKNPDMSLSTLYALYQADIQPRLKERTVHNKTLTIEKWIIPYLGNMEITQITPLTVRKWHEMLLKSGLKPSSMRAINSQLSAMLNFAVKFYSLPNNPVRSAGSVGKASPKRLNFWTQNDFNTFISDTNLEDKTLFSLLFYGGFRIGELLAITPSDVDFDSNTIRVSKTYARIKKKDIVTTPKTDNSVRDVLIPAKIMALLKEYMIKIYGLDGNTRIFCITNHVVGKKMKKIISETGVKTIRVHDLRHSHVSLLIEMGYSPYLIAERIGDTVDMVMKVYGHLYPNKHAEMVEKLNEIIQ